MHDRSRIGGQFRGKNVFASGSEAAGKAMLRAECGRVMAATELAEIPGDQLQLTNASVVGIQDNRGTRRAHTR